MKRASKASNRFFFILTLIGGFLIILPELFYQNMLFVGDHGRDLYAIWQTSLGHLPYRDFFWDYGPLPLYYYAFFLDSFSGTIQGVLLAEIILKLFSGVLVFFILRRLSSPAWSYLAALFFFSYYPYFFHTYSHTLGVSLLLVIIYFLIRYIDTHKKPDLYGAVFAIFLLSFVKINLALASLAGCIIFIFFIDQRIKNDRQSVWGFYITTLVILPFISFLIYFLFLHEVPKIFLQQTFHYADYSHQAHVSFIELITKSCRFLRLYTLDHWRNTVIVALFFASLLGFILYYRKKGSGKEKVINSSVLLLGLFYFIHIHEFIISGIYYRLFWGAPFLILLLFICVNACITKMPKAVGIIVFVLIGVIIIHKINAKYERINMHLQKKNYLALDRASLFLGNPLGWIDTVETTVLFLDSHLKNDELFLALPYEPLYYFLLARPNPVYQISFFDYMHPSRELEQHTINSLKDKNVNWVLLSNRMYGHEPGLGTFGVSYSVKLAEYINENFRIMLEVGNWSGVPIWNENHAVQILKRIP